MWRYWIFYLDALEEPWWGGEYLKFAEKCSLIVLLNRQLTMMLADLEEAVKEAVEKVGVVV